MRKRRKVGSFMRTDDRVMAHVSRRRAGWFVAMAILMLTTGIVIVALALNAQSRAAEASASLSRDEVTQLRSYMSDRTQQRDTERAEVQAQLDVQGRALCAALVAFEPGASPGGLTKIRAAERALSCAAQAKAGTLDRDNPPTVPP